MQRHASLGHSASRPRPPSQRLVQDVARLAASLPAGLPRTRHPSLVLVSGLPGSGKSHFGRLLAARLPLAVLESDALRKRLVATPTYSGPENGRLFRAAHELARQLLASGVSVLFDATNLIEAHRRRLYRIAEEAAARVAVVRLEAPKRVVYQRLQYRREGLDPQDSSDADWDVYERMRSRLDPIRREHLVVDSSQDVGSAVDQVVRWVAAGASRPHGETTPAMQ